MDSCLALAQKKQRETIALIREMVECESPSDDAKAVTRCAELIADRTRDIAKAKFLPGGTFGKNLRLEFMLPGKRKDGQILALGHADTVWPMGTLASMPFREKEGRLWGPGVLDMKGGVGFFITAMRILRALDVPVARKVVLQINSDEEVGSDSSRGFTEEAARASAAVLVLEPGTGLHGALKTARKGVGHFDLKVNGIAAHAGVDPRKGASAIVELAKQLIRIGELNDFDRGVTVNPGVIAGGTRSNVTAAEARAEIDFRAPTMRDAVKLEKKIRSLKPYDKRCSLSVEGGLNRPPMERSAGVRKLYALAEKLAKEIGVKLEESSTGGGSDGNFTAAVGAPTLDGLGAVGEGAHATHESLLVDRIADRTALMAKLVAAI
jgi:glutamate carboxypeptidase